MSTIIRNIRNLFQRKYYMPAISVVFAALMIYAFVIYLKNVQPLDLPQNRKWSEIQQSDTLRVVTIPSSYTAFEYRDHWYGHEYDLVHRLADSLGLVLDMLVVNTEQEVIDSLYSGAADLSIWPIRRDVAKQLWYLRPTGLQWDDPQVLISMRKLKQLPVLDSLQLTQDSLSLESHVDAMAKGRVEAILLRRSIAKLMKAYYPAIKMNDTIQGRVDTISWFAITGADTLRFKIDSVMALIDSIPSAPIYSVNHKRLYQQANGRHVRKYKLDIESGHLSPYDTIFQRCAKEIGWDWRLLAAIGYIETKFDHTLISSRGPIGLMQLMPATVRNLGYTQEEVIDPSVNVSVAVTLIKRIQDALRRKMPDATEQDLLCCTIAGYNIGPGHIYDAIELASELGYNPQVWYDNIEQCLRLKSDPKYYGLPVVKLGPCNGNFTINYLHEVMEAYDAFCRAVHK